MLVRNTLQVELVGRGIISLSANDHVATGGEGSVYRPSNGQTVIKLFTDPAKMGRDGMPEKLQLLSRIVHPYVVAPKDLVLDTSKRPIGYYMPFVAGEALSRVFTSSWWQREGFDHKAANVLVDHMRETVQVAHKAKAVMVDANELNWILVYDKKKEPEPRVLDVDSWAIGRWPATVIMPSIRDWHAQRFSELTDWFAWGVVTFQILSGIHPYKGMLDGFKPNQMELRMRTNASVFRPDVRLNNAVRDFNTIPGPLLDWYVATFEKGVRTAPPSPFDTGKVTTTFTKIARVVVTGNDTLVYDKLFGDPNDPALSVFGCGVALLASGRLVTLSNKRVIGTVKSHACEVVEQTGGWIKADYDGTTLTASYINAASLVEQPLDLPVVGQRFVRYENRLFIVTDRGLTEVALKVYGSKAMLVMGSTWGAMVNSTRWHNGVGIQDAMGAMFLVVPFGEKSCTQVRVKELDGLRPVTAKVGNRFVAVVVVDKQGQYKRIEFTFNAEYTTYSIQEELADNPDLNMALLPKPNGVVVASITEDGELKILVPTSGHLKKVADRQISTDMVLANWNDTVVYIQNGAVWSVKMR